MINDIPVNFTPSEKPLVSIYKKKILIAKGYARPCSVQQVIEHFFEWLYSYTTANARDVRFVVVKQMGDKLTEVGLYYKGCGYAYVIQTKDLRALRLSLSFGRYGRF